MREVYIDDEGRVFKDEMAELFIEADDALIYTHEVLFGETKKPKGGNEMTNIREQLDNEIQKSKEERDNLKSKLNRFRRGALATLKDKEAISYIVNPAVIGGIVVGAADLISNRDIKQAAKTVVKTTTLVGATGTISTATLGGLMSSMDKEYLEYLEED